jgi:hypothetical protein
MRARLAGLAALLRTEEKQATKKPFHDSGEIISRLQGRLFVDPKQELFKLSQVARGTDVSKQTVRRWVVSQGVGVVARSGGRHGTYLLPKAVVEEFLVSLFDN